MELSNEMMKLTLIGMYASMLPSIKHVELSLISERIEEIRGLIISKEKNEKEVNELLDELEKLSVKKRDVESLIASIKRVREKCKELDEQEKNDEKTTKLTSEEEEA